jgi:subtilisin family serine protease
MPGQNSWDRFLVTRIADQVKTITSAFKAQRNMSIQVEPVSGGVGYMYPEGQLLVRDEYLKRVYQIVNPGDESIDLNLIKRIVPGVSLLKLKVTGRQPMVKEALDIIDLTFGTDIATPDHVLTVAPAGPCPSTEPEEVYFASEPFPSVCTENCGSGVLVYIADTGLLQDAEVDHPWLRGVERALDLQPDGTWTLQDPDPAGIVLDGTTTIPPYAGHGTFVAGVVRCMAPEADVIVSNIFKVAGSTLESDLVVELDQALELGVDVFNLSITTTSRDDLPLLGFDGFLRRLRQYKGVICIVAAGNNGLKKPNWPAANKGTVSVGALGADWRGRASFSNYGGWVDVYAPGRNLINAFATGPYTCQDYPYKNKNRNFYGMARWSGTSFSTPIVTGLVAARMSRTGESGQEAAAALLSEARARAIPGVGAILLPCGSGSDNAAWRAGCTCCHKADCHEAER